MGRHAETLSTVDMLEQLSSVIAVIRFEHLFSLSSQKLIAEDDLETKEQLC